ncbi:condensation domain-containing protein, partial [Oxalobacteraceae bacterium A2-2]
MALTELLELCKRNGIGLSVADGDLRIQGKKSAVSSGLIALLKEHKPALVAFLSAYRPAGGDAPEDAAIPLADRSQPLALSFAQQRLWFVDQLQQGGAEYHLQSRHELCGPLDGAALERALQAIVDRHEVLRTAIVSEDGQARQVVRHGAAPALQTMDLRTLAPDARRLALARLAAQDEARPFDLARDVLLRAHLVRLEEERHVLLLNLHHIAADGWSMAILMRELGTLYDAYRQGREPALAPLPVQYADYAQWQRGWLRGGELERQLGYWRGRLAGLPAVHGLPLDQPRPARQRFLGRTLAQTLDAGLVGAIQSYCQREQVTLFMFLQTALAVLLGRYSGAADIVIGSPTAGRVHSDVEDLIGLFVNSLVLRNDLAGDPTFPVLLRRSKQMILGAYEHQHVPFEMLVEELRPERSLSHSPLYQVMFTLHNTEQRQMALAGLDIVRQAGSHGAIKCDLELTATAGGGQLHVDWSYNIDLFEQASMTRLASNFEQLLHAIVAQPETPIGALPLLADAERETLLHGWNRTAAVQGGPATVPALFEAQAAATPQALAVRGAGEELSYGVLNAIANRIAHHLRAQGLAQGGLVGLCMDRSATMVAAMLAILKAGGAYLPLDPGLPAARLELMVRDAGLRLILTRGAHLALLPEQGVRAICLDGAQLDQILAAGSDANPPRHDDGEAPACAIYTSGSTGTPKAVLMPHRAIANRLQWMRA